MEKKAIVWFRQDLRIHDNEALIDALSHTPSIIPIYVFDSRTFKGTTKYGFPKTGKYRAQFIIEAVADLRKSIQALGSDLIIAEGKPEEIIFDLAKEQKCSWVFCNRERTHEEVEVQDALETNMWSIGAEVRFSRGKMLYYTQDLPFPVTHTPDLFTTFRKELEKIVNVRLPLDRPESLQPLPKAIETGELPSILDFGHSSFSCDERAAFGLQGGETAGLARLREYFWDTDLVSHYKETRNGLVGKNYSSKFSAYLSQGCLSPKYIYAELKKYENERGSNESTYWLFFELLWRDFFRLMGKKYGNAIFTKGGIKNNANQEWSDDMKEFAKWAEGKTDEPFVDANMHELVATGFMSNRGRQNVASYLVRNLKINWQIGAEYFESLLVDYDPCSNWCNWNYIAGVGNDPRNDRTFNMKTQAEKYDPDGTFIRLWNESEQVEL